MILAVINGGKPVNYIVKIEQATYTFKNVAKAIDVVFKAHWVFNLEYQYECRNIFTFLQLFFYELESVADNVSGKVRALISDLK